MTWFSAHVRHSAALFIIMLMRASSAFGQSVQTSLRWTTNYYLVTGDTLAEVYGSLNRARPSVEKNEVDGLTTWRIEWSFTTALSDRGCRCQSLTVRTIITTTLPRWNATTNAGAAAREEWLRYVTALGKHEFGHAQYAQAASAALQKRVQQLGELTDCDSLKKTIRELGQQILEQHRELEKGYDEKTQHGATQGAVRFGGMHRVPRAPR